MEYTEQQKKIYNDVCEKYKHNWLNTTISQTMAMEMISKALNIHSVSQRSEILDFKEWWNNLPDESDDRLYMTDETIDRYLKSNCG